MGEEIIIKVVNIIGSNSCISIEKGQQVFIKVRERIKKGAPVILSFEKAEEVSLVFLNTVIGQLYGIFDENIIKENLKVKGLSSWDMDLLKSVVDNAKRYFNKKGDNETCEKKITMHSV